MVEGTHSQVPGVSGTEKAAPTAAERCDQWRSRLVRVDELRIDDWAQRVDIINVQKVLQWARLELNHCEVARLELLGAAHGGILLLADALELVEAVVGELRRTEEES